MPQKQSRNEDWLLAERAAIAAQIEEGFAQAERGELVSSDEAIRIQRDSRGNRQIAFKPGEKSR